MSNIPCSIPGCDRAVKARLLCRHHYEAWRLTNRTKVLPYGSREGGCSVGECSGVVVARGLCGTHYARWRRTGTTEVARPNPHGTPEERFWRQVDKQGSGGCWLWTGDTKHRNGYGGLKISKARTVMAHRFAYELLAGPVPDGLELDHLCRVRHCVNPAHLEPVTRRENVRRGISPAALCAQQTHCKYGHPFTQENTYLAARGERVCRECGRRRTREYLRRKGTG